jgi:hypothetical protein
MNERNILMNYLVFLLLLFLRYPKGNHFSCFISIFYVDKIVRTFALFDFRYFTSMFFFSSVCFVTINFHLMLNINRFLGLGAIQIIRDTLGQCFSTFFGSRHPSDL